MDIEIEKGIPLPNKAVGGKTRTYPFSKMDVGDSFTVPNPKNLSIAQLRNQVNSAVYAFSKNTDTKFTVRAIDGEVKVWRTK